MKTANDSDVQTSRGSSFHHLAAKSEKSHDACLHCAFRDAFNLLICVFTFLIVLSSSNMVFSLIYFTSMNIYFWLCEIALDKGISVNVNIYPYTISEVALYKCLLFTFWSLENSFKIFEWAFPLEYNQTAGNGDYSMKS